MGDIQRAGPELFGFLFPAGRTLSLSPLFGVYCLPSIRLNPPLLNLLKRGGYGDDGPTSCPPLHADVDVLNRLFFSPPTFYERALATKVFERRSAFSAIPEDHGTFLSESSLMLVPMNPGTPNQNNFSRPFFDTRCAKSTTTFFFFVLSAFSMRGDVFLR